MRREATLSFEPQGFTDVEPIARGGMGEILRARETSMGRIVALKVFPDFDGSSADRELAVAGWLGVHPHLVTVHGRGRIPSGPEYLVMPWYDGGSLADEVRRRGPLPVAETLVLGVKLAGALAHLHRHGVVHRDVKPANVLISAAGEPALADFGLASLPGEAHQPAAGLTPLHAAPEVLRGEESTPRSDVWSLVSTLCTVLDRSDVPFPLAGLLTAATSVDPDQRPADGSELAARLQGVQELLDQPVTPIPAVQAPTFAAPAVPAPAPAPAWAIPAPANRPFSPPQPETVLRHPRPTTHRRPWKAIALGTLTGTALGLLVLVLASVLHLW
jgi:serine/threonine-protein kinase PknK